MAKIPRKAGARTKVRKKHPRKPAQTWMACGFDISMSSIAGAAIAYDGTLREIVGPAFVEKRWERNTHYFDRITDLSQAHDFIIGLQTELKLVAELNEVYIAVEEPWPMGRGLQQKSSTLKQQAEFSGAFLGGLLRYGFTQVFQIHNTKWRQVVAQDLGITISKVGGWDKWRPKVWALEIDSVPDWPDLIQHSKHGKIPRPEGSKAKAVQPDDRYDALAICEWMRRELQSAT